MSTSDDLPFWTAQQAADYLDIALRTFYRKAGRGEVPGARKVSGVWLVDADVLREEKQTSATLETA